MPPAKMMLFFNACIARFLFLAHHRDKFVFTETEEVLYRSAAFKKDFSGYKAAAGWNALQIYAGNLLTQPWRKEYRQIKTYCGFYKHEIEAKLDGAETIFGAMGYKHVGNGILVLEGPICPDKVSNISKDCLVAYMECQILKHIWEEVSPVYNVGWLDILEFRVYCPGSIEQFVENISKQFQQRVHSTRVEPYESRHQSDTPTGEMSISATHIAVPNSHNYAALASHSHVALPTVVVPQVPYCVPHTNGCQTTFPAYGYGTYPAHLPIVKQPLPATAPNGYYYSGALPLLPPMYPVPTAQLIEVDSRNGYDTVDEGPPARSRRPRVESNGTLESDRVIRNDSLSKNGVSSPAQDEKQDIEENWDYVYKNLEKQGYSKDLGERGDVLGLTVSDKQRKHSKETKKVKSTNLDEVLNSLSVTERPLKMTEALEQMEKKPIERPVPSKERRHSQGSSYENVVSNESLKQTKSIARTVQNTSLPSSVARENSENDPPKSNVSMEVKKTKEKEKVLSSKWECQTCTYLNDFSKDICDICSKSKHVGLEQPMEVGGSQCSACTLVNPRSAKLCQACNNSLKNSPTYI